MNYEKKLFEKKLFSLSGRNIIVVVLLLVLALGSLLCAMFACKRAYVDFSPERSGGYAKAEVKYLMGPFAEYTENGKTTNEYYLAEDEDGLFVVGTGAKTSIPVYGEDVSDEDLDGLKPQVLEGKSKFIKYEMASYIRDFFEDGGYDMSDYYTSDIVGDYYLDTTEKGNEFSIVLYVIAGVLAFAALLYWSITTRKVMLIKKGIMSLENNGYFDAVYEDFEKSRPIYSKACRLAVSDHYVINCSDLKSGVTVLPLQNFNNVFRCNMINGDPTSTTYIAVEDENKRYLLTSIKEGKTNKLDEVVSYMKTRIGKEAE